MNILFQALFYALCTVVLLQDIIGIFLFNLGVHKYLLQLFLASKDVLLFVIIAVNLATCAVKKVRIYLNAAMCFFACYFAIVVYYFLMQDNKAAVINDFRSLTFPIYAYFAGYTSFYLREEKMMKCMGRIALLSVVCSILFYLGGPAFFTKVGTLSYTETIKQYYGLTFNNLPSTFFSYFGRVSIFRLAGPILNPNGTATLYVFVAGLFIAHYRLVKKERGEGVLITLLLLAIFLTFSRGSIAGFILGLLLMNFLWRGKKNQKKQIFVIYGGMLIALAAFYNIFSSMIRDTFLLQDPSTRSHYDAIRASWAYLKDYWMGSGIGSIGMWRGTDYAGGAGENSFIFIIGQVGVFAFIFLAGFYFNVIKNLIRRRYDYLSSGLFICAVAILFNSVFSPSLLAVTPLVLFWFFAGYAQRQNMRENIIQKEAAESK